MKESKENGKARASFLPEDDAEGCGYSPIIWNDPTLFSACAIHDAEYGSNFLRQSEKTRAQVDKEFLSNMLDLSKGKPLARARAYVYYWIVRAVGGLFW